MPEGLDRWHVIQWVYWQAANVGPNFGNKLSYTRYMDDVDPALKEHPLERFGKEARRLAHVLDKQLGDNPGFAVIHLPSLIFRSTPGFVAGSGAKLILRIYPSRSLG